MESWFFKRVQRMRKPAERLVCRQSKDAGLTIKKNAGKQAEENDAGVAMIFVMIVGAVVLAFCLSLLLVTYTLFSQTSRQTTQMQCKLLAQSFSEMLGEELKDPASELSLYLGEQIQNGYWISNEEQNSETEEMPQTGSVSELVLHLGDADALEGYQLSVTLTYSLNLPDEDGDDEGDEKDDQDNNLSGGTENGGTEGGGTDSGGNESGGSESVSGNNAGSKPGNGTCFVTARIQCARGDTSDRDAQIYTIEAVYPAVTL